MNSYISQGHDIYLFINHREVQVKKNKLTLAAILLCAINNLINVLYLDIIYYYEIKPYIFARFIAIISIISC